MWETTMRIMESEVVDGEPGQVWALLSSPGAWSLWPDAGFMFAVPEAPALRFFIGPTTGRRAGKVLYEITDERPGAMIRLRTLPTGRQEFTLSVAAGRPGTANACVRVKEVVPRLQKIGFEKKRRDDIKKWLSAVRAVIEGRAPWPGADMTADLRQACMDPPRITIPQSTSASALISADPATVWDAVHSPETGRTLGPSPPIYSGYVPGTPQGEAGEMQYFISRRDDSQLTGQVVVVTETSAQRSALTHALGPLQLETRYLLTPESDSGPTRLDLTFRWQKPELTDAANAVRSETEAAQALANAYKSLIETVGQQE
jgi:hypothetical protein